MDDGAMESGMGRPCAVLFCAVLCYYAQVVFSACPEGKTPNVRKLFLRVTVHPPTTTIPSWAGLTSDASVVAVIGTEHSTLTRYLADWSVLPSLPLH